MPQFAAGLTDALDSIERRKYEEAQINRIQDEVAASARAEKQADQQRERQRKAAAGVAEFYASQPGTPQVAPPPPGAMTPQTAVPPGQASQPMVRPPPAAAAFGPQGAPPPSLQPPPPSAQLPPSVGGQPPAGMPPQPQGWRPSASAPPNLGGQPPGQQGGPGAAPMPSVDPPPVPTPPPQVLDSLPSVFQWAVKQGKSYDEAYDIAAAAAPIQDSHNKALLAEMKQEVDIQRELAAHEKMLRERAASEAGPKPPAPTAFEKEAADLYGKGTPAYKKAMEKHIARMDAPTAATINMNAGGENDLSKDKDTLREMAAQAWRGDTSVYTNLGRGAQGAKNIVALRKEVTAMGKEQGKTPEEIGEQLAMANAEFAGTKAGERTLGTRTANIEMAATEAYKLADLALETSEKLPRTGVKSLNDVMQAGQKATASPELRAFTAANTSLINAYARAINPQGVGTVADKEHAREMLSTGFSKGDYKASVDQLKKEIDAAKASPAAVKSDMRSRSTGAASDKKVVHWDDLK